MVLNYRKQKNEIIIIRSYTYQFNVLVIIGTLTVFDNESRALIRLCGTQYDKHRAHNLTLNTRKLFYSK